MFSGEEPKKESPSVVCHTKIDGDSEKDMMCR